MRAAEIAITSVRSRLYLPMAIKTCVRSTWLLPVLCLLALGAIGCGQNGYKQVETEENLEGLLDLLVKSAEAGQTEQAAAMMLALICDEAAIRKAFKDDTFKDERRARNLAKWLADLNAHLPTDDRELARAIHRGKTTQTEVRAHGATPNEIAAGSTPAAKEFLGASYIAEHLRPGLRFYEVEFTEPGADSGMKYHLFFWDGSRWRMLGPAADWLNE